MFWNRIREKLNELGATQKEWSQSYMAIPLNGGVCGITGTLNGCEYSIICHRYSYGGEEGLFEVMPDINNNGDVTGNMTESEVFEYLEKMAYTDFFKE